jgi:hypothetical protein
MSLASDIPFGMGFGHSLLSNRVRRDGLWVFVVNFIVFAFLQAALGAELEWENGPGFRRFHLSPAGSSRGFTLVEPRASGITCTNSLPLERYSERQNLMNGAGVACADIDQDGLCDLCVCNKFAPCALYKNLGNWQFQDITPKAGVSCSNLISIGAVFGDINGDGLPDLLVTSFTGPNAVFLNLGNDRFTNITQSAGISPKGGCTSMAFGDLDGDGWLDLYVCYFGIEAILREGSAISTRMVGGKPIVTGRFAKRLVFDGTRLIEVGEPSILYHNDRGLKFAPLSWEQTFFDESGNPMAAPSDYGLAIQIRDINGDGFPDIYTCNDFQTPDRLWLNDGHGKFHAIAPLALRNMSYASMGVDFADFDRDGNLDFFTVEMLSRDHSRNLSQSSPRIAVQRPPGVYENREDVPRNVLCWNRGDGTYADIAWYAGVAASDWSWTPIFLDVDLDGYEDILISNGHLHNVNFRDMAESRDVVEKRSTAEARKRLLSYTPLNTANVAFRNRGDMTFEDVSDAWHFNSTAISHGMALADLDNDGDLDLIVNAVNAPPLVYRNEASAARIAVRLRGKAPNVLGIGAKITLEGGPFAQTQEMISGGRYLSCDDTIRSFAVPGHSGKLSLAVLWRNGTRSVVPDVEPNSLYEVNEEGASAAPAAITKNGTTMPMFEDVSSLLGHTHHEEAYDDFARQLLLPKKLSQAGPGISWFDFNKDGFEDLIIGSGRGGKISVFQNDGRGGFKAAPAPYNQPLPDDSTTILGVSENETSMLLVGISSWERASTNASPLVQALFGTDASPAAFVPSASSAGPLALGDIDGDGDLDLFVGGRCIPGQYPKAASSQFYINGNPKFVPALNIQEKFKSIALVNAAVFSDLDNDGLPELVLACEWGPIRVFKFQNEDVREITRELGLSEMTGLWSSVTTGDFDGDGRMDIVAGNWGLNSFYNRAQGGPWYLYYGDFNGDGRTTIIECYSNHVMQAVVPFRPLPDLSPEIPSLKSRFPSNEAYSRASVQEILRDRFSGAMGLRATTLASTIFWNRGDHFEAQALPPQAQWAPAFGLNVADFNGDGRDDLFIAQNFFAVRPEDDRLDAGRGLLLLGKEKGFVAVPGQESGLKIYGEQRGSAVADFDGDGRVDLCVSQNGAQSKLYRNSTAKPGLRVRLNGPAANPFGYGVKLRIRENGQSGPAREIHCGSGYWSQDGATQVLSVNSPDAEILIRWPGQKELTAKIPAGAKEISINTEGQITVIH